MTTRKRIRAKTALIICLFAFVQQAVFAQRADYFGIWTLLEAEKPLTQKWSIKGELEFRSRENLKEIDRWAMSVGADYMIIRNLEAGVAYQFQYYHDIKYADYQPRHRLIGFLEGSRNWGRLTFALRERFQVTYKDDSDRINNDGTRDSYSMDPEWTWRNRLRVLYDIPKSKFTPSASVETSYALNNPDGNDFFNLRYTLAIAYRLDRNSTFSLSGFYDQRINQNNPVNRCILSIGYGYSF